MTDENGVVRIKSETISEDETVVRVRHNWGKTGRLIVEDDKGKDVTYELNPIRSFDLVAQTLEVMRVGEMPEGDGILPVVETRAVVRGKAILNGTLGVIGAPDLETNVLNLSLRAASPSDHRVQAWTEHNEVMPTADVGFNRANWEYRSQDEWFAECYVSESAFADIVASITIGRARSFEIDLHLQNIYTSDLHAPHGARVKWFFRPDRKDNSIKMPEMAHGFVKRLRLYESTVNLVIRNESPEEEATEQVESISEPLHAPPQESNPVADAINLLTVQVGTLQKIGVWIVLAIAAAVVVIKL